MDSKTSSYSFKIKGESNYDKKSQSDTQKITNFFPVLPEGRAKMCALKSGDSKQKEMIQKLKNKGTMSLRPKRNDTKPAAEHEAADVNQGKEKIRNMCVLSALKTPLSQVLRKSIEASENKKEPIEKVYSKGEESILLPDSVANQEKKISDGLDRESLQIQKLKKSVLDIEGGMSLRQKSSPSTKIIPSLRSHAPSRKSVDHNSEPSGKRKGAEFSEAVASRNKYGSNISNNSSSSSSSSRGEDTRKESGALNQGNNLGKPKKNRKRHFKGSTYGLYLTPAKKKKKQKQQKTKDDESKDDECSLAGTENSSYLDSEDGNSLVSEDFYTPSEKSLADEERPDSRNSPTHLHSDQKMEHSESNMAFDGNIENPESNMAFDANRENPEPNMTFDGHAEHAESDIIFDGNAENPESDVVFDGNTENPESDIVFDGNIENQESDVAFEGQMEQPVYESQIEQLEPNVDFEGQTEHSESNMEFEGQTEHSESNMDFEGQTEYSESNMDFDGQTETSENNEQNMKIDECEPTSVITENCEEISENATDQLQNEDGLQWDADKKFDDSSADNRLIDEALSAAQYDDISNESFSNSTLFPFKDCPVESIEDVQVQESEHNASESCEEQNNIDANANEDNIVNINDISDKLDVKEVKHEIESGTSYAESVPDVTENNDNTKTSFAVNNSDDPEISICEAGKENIDASILNENEVKDDYNEKDLNDSQSTIANCVKSRQRIKRRFTDDIVDTDLGLLSLDTVSVARKMSLKPPVPDDPKDIVLTFQSVKGEGKKALASKIECVFNSHQKPIRTCTCDADLADSNFVPDDDGDYCQAVDSVDDKLIGCYNPIVTTKLVRPAVRLSFTVMCEMHLWRLKHHQACPYCGVFCSQGSFVQCVSMKNKKMISHLFHECCQPREEGQYPFCPHCGATTGMKRVNVSLQMVNPPAFFFNQVQKLPVPQVSKAKISFSATSEFLKKEEEELYGEKYTIESSGKVLSSAGLPFGPEKDEFEKLLQVLTSEQIQCVSFSVDTFYTSAEKGDVEKMLYMLAQGFDPNYKFPNHENETALHAAAASGHIVVVHLLIQAGAVCDSHNEKIYTPLMLAVENSHIDIVHYLVKRGACTDFKGENGMSSLHLAAKSGNSEVLKLLLTSREVDVNSQDDGGWTPIVWASEHDHYHVVKYLLKKGANPNIRDNEGNIGLHWSAFSGSVDICHLYLEYGCDVNAVNELGDTPLHIAARQDSLPCVTLFLSRDADVQIKNKSNQVPAECVIDKTSDTYLSLSLNLVLKKITSKYQHKAEKIIYRDISRGKEQIAIQCVNGIDDEPAPLDFLYVTENCETMPINIDRAITSLQSCHCEDDCTTNSCTCANVSYKCWYDKEGLLLPEFNLVEPPMLFECNRGCSCWSLNCHNRVLQNGITCRLQLVRTKGKGWGVRTLKDIPKGAFICEYVGELISDSVADKRTDDSYLFDLDNRDGETYCLDARYYGNISRFINHLCDPNLVPVKIFVDHQDLNFPRIAFFSSREIKQYEELGFDYGEKFWSIKYKQFTCECGTPTCKYSKETIHSTLANYYRRLKEEQLEEAGSSQQPPTAETKPEEIIIV